MEPFLGQLLLASFNFAPRSFVPANGQVLSIQQYTALFALFGTFYGGNGQTTFALPDLRGRVPIHQGSYDGTVFTIGQPGGEESHTVAVNETPRHTHQATAIGTATSPDPVAAYLGGNQAAAFNTLPNPPASMNSETISTVGGSQPHENRQPFLVMNWLIAMQGIFPSRN
jgi:microcystin-dependent protein